jgi:hypothetical protein
MLIGKWFKGMALDGSEEKEIFLVRIYKFDGTRWGSLWEDGGKP